MPRQARVIVPGMPHHIVQRGHNRNAVFVEFKDYQYYLENLAEWKAELGLKVFSYCLMTNHVHLVVEAGDDRSGVGQLMKRLAGRQTRFVNKMEGRTGSLWESRYKISPIDTDAYLLQCCRYVELNPVMARKGKGDRFILLDSERTRRFYAKTGKGGRTGNAPPHCAERAPIERLSSLSGRISSKVGWSDEGSPATIREQHTGDDAISRSQHQGMHLRGQPAPAQL